MFRRVFLTGIVAGLLTGLAFTLVQAFTTVPLILQAEVYEAGGAASSDHAHAPGVAAHEHDATAWSPAEGLERSFYTGLANIITAVGFGLVLSACLALHGKPVDPRRGVVWGLAGYAVFSLAPALGLPPEVPGSIAAELAARQAWWFFAVGGAALGLWLMIFGRASWMWGLGIVALALPHAIGAPHPDGYGDAVPPELAAQFVAASIATMAVFWALLGWFAGAAFRRLGPTQA